jgi:hypothetical protein
MTTTTKFGVDLINSAPKKCPFRYDLSMGESAPCGFLCAHARCRCVSMRWFMYFMKNYLFMIYLVININLLNKVIKEEPRW